MIIKLPGFIKGEFKHFVDIDKLDDNSIIVDVGACMGDVIKALRNYKQTAKCSIFAIECNRKLAKYLRKQNFFNVQICEKALAGQDVREKTIFFEGKRGPNWGSVDFALLKERWGNAVNKYKVKTLKINDIFSEFDIDRIDYMKMDIEGAEKKIFDAMSIKTAKKIKQLSVEIHWPAPNAGITMDWAKKRLIELEFEMIHIGRCEIFCEHNKEK